MNQYANDVQRFVDTMFQTPPFDELRLAINVFRIDVTSTDSGADDPTACGGSGATARTYFDATFCGDGQNQRLLVVNNTTALDTADAQVPQWNVVLVVINSSVYGGSGGAVGTYSLAAGAEEIALHELGHTAFGLADEYEYFRGCASGETDRNNHPAVEPAEVNVTINTDRATLKWGHLVAAATPIPTTTNANCAQCDPQASPVAAGTVGLFEGAHYYDCDSFRPEFNCKMRALGNPFCAVCRERIRTVLTPYLPVAGWHFNLTVNSVFGYSGTQNAQAHLSGFGWRIVVPGAPDGVTNVHVVLSDAAVKGRRVNAFIDGAGRIVSAYLA
jgi:IgA Peptidase M64